MEATSRTIPAAVKRFVVDSLIEPLLPLRVLEAYVIFWARLVFRARKPLVVGITGSVGKSTTTAMIADVLSDARAMSVVGSVGKTVSNMNDDLGVAATLLRFTEPYVLPWSRWRRPFVFLTIAVRALRVVIGRYPRILVLEFGIGPTASFERMVATAPPTIAIVTRIGAAHLALMNSVDGVVREKGKLVAAVPPTGLVVLGDDHEYVAALATMARAPVLKASGRGIELSRAIASIACKHLGVPEDIVTPILRDFQELEGRLNVVQLGDFTLIDDSYNATPMSMQFGLDTLAKTARPGQRKVAILGQMAGLGDDSPRYHDEIGEHARRCADVVIGVDDLGRHYRPDAWFENSRRCAQMLDTLIHDGDCVFVKGSFAAKMGYVVDGLRDRAAARRTLIAATDASAQAQRSASGVASPSFAKEP